jgi:hypothetical protein
VASQVTANSNVIDFSRISWRLSLESSSLGKAYHAYDHW